MKTEKKIVYLTESGIRDEKKYLFALEFTIVDQTEISCIVVVNSENDISDKESPVYRFNNQKCTIEFLHRTGGFVEGNISLKNISPDDGTFTSDHNTFLFDLQYGTNRERTHSLLGVFYLKTLELEEIPEETSKPIENENFNEETVSENMDVEIVSERTSESEKQESIDEESYEEEKEDSLEKASEDMEEEIVSEEISEPAGQEDVEEIKEDQENNSES